MPLLSANNLSCERGGLTLFEGLDFSVAAGELLQIQGANGSGKTTLVRIAAGLSSSYSGQLCRDALAGAEHFLYIGHKPGVKLMLTPMENLRWYLAADAAASKQQAGKTDADILQALALWQLKGYEQRPCYQLSAGQQQRVALARLYLTEAALWLLDEPFTAIDQTGVAQLEALLLAHAERGGAVVLTTHHVFRHSQYLRFLSLPQTALLSGTA